MATIDTIIKLLAKAERTDNEHERNAYLAKAQELQTAHAIEQGMVDAARAASGQAQAPEGMKWIRLCEERNTPLIKAKRELANALGQLNNCFVTMAPGRAYIQITGHESDVVMVEHMFASVMLQLQRAMDQAEKRGEAQGTVKGWRVSYAHAYVGRVWLRLQAARAATMAASTGGTPGSALVLRDRAAVSQQYYLSNFGGVKRARRIPTEADKNIHGLLAGDRDGRRADLGGQRLGGGRKEIGQ